MRIGFIGLGAMGLPMSGHLVAAGHDVTVASAGPRADRGRTGRGAVDGGSARGVAEASEVVIVCVPNSPEVIEVVDAMLPALGPGKTVVDCSTIDPEVERAQHERVGDTGARYLDAPLSGGTAGAHNGTLTLMVGGDAAVLDATQPAFDPFAGLVVHVGGPGMGQVVKLCNNLIYAAQMTATAEATAMAVASGVDMAKLYEVLTHATGDCVAVRTRLPVPGVVPDSPASNGWAARLHDRPDGQGHRPGAGLRRPLWRPGAHHGGRPAAPDGGQQCGLRPRGLLGPGQGVLASPAWRIRMYSALEARSRLGPVLAADHRARAVRLPRRTGHRDYFGALGAALPFCDGSWPPAALAGLTSRSGIWRLSAQLSVVDRTGLAGSVFELDDRLVARCSGPPPPAGRRQAHDRSTWDPLPPASSLAVEEAAGARGVIEPLGGGAVTPTRVGRGHRPRMGPVKVRCRPPRRRPACVARVWPVWSVLFLARPADAGDGTLRRWGRDPHHRLRDHRHQGRALGRDRADCAGAIGLTTTHPQAGWAEQDPLRWWTSLVIACAEGHAP